MQSVPALGVRVDFRRDFEAAVDALGSLVQQWYEEKPKPLERAAALKDFMVLASTGDRLNLRKSEDLEVITFLRKTMLHCLKAKIVAKLQQNTTTSQARLVSSPYAGGINLASLRRAYDHQGCQAQGMESLCVAVLNPGRSGLAVLGTNELMVSRLFEIARSLHELNIHICILPGARMPPGSKLPANLPYTYRGPYELGWNTVGALIINELDPQVTDIEDLCNERILWLHCPSGHKAPDAPPAIIGGFCAKHGGDVSTF